MAASATITNKSVAGNRRSHTGTLNLGSYVTNGVPITPGLFGLHKLEDLIIPPVPGATMRSVAVDWTNNKIVAYVAAGTEVAGAVDLSTVPLRFTARGIG